MPASFRDEVVALAAGDRVVAGTAIDGQRHGAGNHCRRVDHVVAGAAVDGQLVGGILMADDDAGGGAEDPDAAIELAAVEGKQPDRVVAGGAVDRHRVGLTVPDAAAERACKVDQHSDSLDVGAGEIVDHDVVGPAEGVDVDPLDAVEVHDDVADVAGESHPPAVGRDVDVLVDVGAVEHECVVAGLALDRVAAVARVPDERVVARTEERHVVPAPPITASLPSPPLTRSSPCAADDRVVAGAAIDGQRHGAGNHCRSIDHVVAGAAVDGQLVGGILMADDDAGGGAEDPDAAIEVAGVEGKQPDRVVAGGAIGRHRVDLTVADAAAERACKVDQHSDSLEIGPGDIVDHDVVGAARGRGRRSARRR